MICWENDCKKHMKVDIRWVINIGIDRLKLIFFMLRKIILFCFVYYFFGVLFS